MKRTIKMTLILFFASFISISASPGRLKSASIQTCNGVTYGSHSKDNHWHVATQNSDGTYNATGDPIYGNPCTVQTQPEPQPEPQPATPQTHQQETPPPVQPKKQEAPVKEEPKSDNKDISNITINDKTIPVESAMTHKTVEKSVSLKVQLEDDEATVEYEETLKLDIGENITDIIVTAEDGSSRTYTLTLVREEAKKSNNTEISIFVNDEEITFKDNVATIEFEDIPLSINHKLIHEKSTTTLDEQFIIDKEESSTVQFVVIAEDGTIQKYVINFVYDSKKEESSDATIGAAFIVSGVFFGVPTYFITKRSTRKKLNSEFQTKYEESKKKLQDEYNIYEVNDDKEKKKRRWFNFK